MFNDIPIHECKSYIFKEVMIDLLYTPPICQHFWTNRFPKYTFNWDVIWNRLPQSTKEARLVSLNWKILHNIYPTKYLLHKMGKEKSNVCDKCNTIDHIDHFFYRCNKINFIWNIVESNNRSYLPNSTGTTP